MDYISKQSIFAIMKYLILVLLSLSLPLSSQTLSGKELLDKAISYHDPNDIWSTFDATFKVTMETPNSANRVSDIKIDLPAEYFSVKATRDTVTTEYELNKSECKIRLNGLSNLSEGQLKTNRLSCERANMYKNYYTYLYGLPMKLKDPGTKVHETVERKTFKNIDYLVLKVTYEEAVGSDIWYFYFNPKTYAMEVYQFYKTDDSGKMNLESGEYILLSDEEIVNGIKMPKTRAWYYNKDDKYLGTDILNK